MAEKKSPIAPQSGSISVPEPPKRREGVMPASKGASGSHGERRPPVNYPPINGSKSNPIR